MQLAIDLEGGLTRQFSTFADVLHAAAYNPASRKPFKHIAADLGVSPGELSKMLSHGEGRHFPGELFPDFLASTGDLRPLHWLIEKFIPNDEQRMTEAVVQLERLMAETAAIVAQVKGARR